MTSSSRSSPKPPPLELLDMLGLKPTPPSASPHATKLDRALRQFEEIQAFYDEHGHAPHPESPNVREATLGNALNTYRGPHPYAQTLVVYDRNSLLAEEEETPRLSPKGLLQTLGLKPQPDGIHVLNHVRHSSIRHAADQIGRREPCKNFEEYRPVFERVHLDIDAGVRKTILYSGLKEKIEQIKKGVFFIIGGQAALVTKTGAPFRQRGFEDMRITVVFDNATECTLLRKSLLKALWRDPHSRLITEPPPLTISGQSSAGDVVSGKIYVLRSLSDEPVIAQYREILHKIGFTTQSMTKRLAAAEKEPTFLLARCEVVREYDLVGLDGKKLEMGLHLLFEDARVDFKIPDRFGTPVNPKEWFLIPIHVIDNAIELLKAGELGEYVYQPKQCELVKRTG